MVGEPTRLLLCEDLPFYSLSDEKPTNLLFQNFRLRLDQKKNHSSLSETPDIYMLNFMVSNALTSAI